MKKFRYVIAYDVSDNRIRNRIFRILKSYGVHAEKSVFECSLTVTTMEHLKNDLIKIMNPITDTLKIYRLTPTRSEAIFTFGKILDEVPQENFVIF